MHELATLRAENTRLQRELQQATDRLAHLRRDELANGSRWSECSDESYSDGDRVVTECDGTEIIANPNIKTLKIRNGCDELVEVYIRDVLAVMAKTGWV
jgi:hypothetical protein